MAFLEKLLGDYKLTKNINIGTENQNNIKLKQLKENSVI